MTVKKVGIIGFGEMGKRHAKDIAEFSNGEIEVAGVVEPSDSSFRAGCEWTGRTPARFASVPAMRTGTALDGVVISTPNYLHWQYLSEFAGAAIPVLLEKPLDTDLDKVRRIVRFAENYRGPIMVHHVMRYSPIILKAKELIGAGAIGRIAGFTFVQFIHGGMFHNFRRTFKTGGGQLLEKATHDFDVLLFLTGSMPVRVAAACRRQCYGGGKPDDLHCPQCPDKDGCKHSTAEPAKDLCVYAREIDIFDNESCLIELKNGIIGTYSECFFSRTAYSRRYEFNGTEGFLAVDFTARRVQLINDRGEQNFDFDYENRIHYNGAPGVTRHFLDLMKHGRKIKVLSPVDEAFAAELISFAAYQSHFSGKFVNIADITGNTVAPDRNIKRKIPLPVAETIK